MPFVFNGDLSAWVEWKHTLASALEVDPRDVVLSGSAAIGFSLNPDKGFREFNDQSDIDCGIVSGYHFDLAWRMFRQQRVSWLSLPRRQKDAIEAHRKNYVFAGTIATDWVLPFLPFSKDWQDALDLMSTVSPTKGRDVKLRIYKDFDALRYYHIRNIANLSRSLGSSSSEDETVDGNSEIPLED